MSASPKFRIGTAGWSVPTRFAESFPGPGTHLERYARRMNFVEINSSFYRPHRPATYANWASMVPEYFRFAVKVPRALTHAPALLPTPALTTEFLSQVAALNGKLAVLLVQFPPRRAFLPVDARDFFASLRDLHPHGNIVVEPRHPTWFTPEADALLRTFQLTRVAADPAIIPAAAIPAGDPQVVYYRLHGSPRIYYSDYPPAFLQALAGSLCAFAAAREVFVVFDNTAAGAALRNAVELQRLQEGRIGRRSTDGYEG